jgi:hypothetical protein
MPVSIRTQFDSTHWVNAIRVAKTQSGLITLVIDFEYSPSYTASVSETRDGATQQGISFAWNDGIDWIEIYIENEPNIRYCGNVKCKKQYEVFFAPWSEFENVEYSKVSL